MAEKKYYWLKLKRDFFKRHDVRIIEQMPNGKDYILFYLKMLLESIDHEGALRFSETIPYNEQMLSVITDTNVDVVKSAMAVFVELGMIELLEDRTIYMNEVQKLIGSESAVAQRVRKHRENRKLLQCNTDETKGNTEIDIDIEKDQEKERERELLPSAPASVKPTRHKYGEYKNVLLSDADMEKLKSEFPDDWKKRIERLSAYIASTGKSYKNHLATIRNWARRDKEKSNAQASGNGMYYMPNQPIEEDSDDFLKQYFPGGV